LSGKDFESVYLEASQTLSHSFLNGSSFKNSTFLGAPIDQTELAEAQIIDCYFADTDFTGSSLIARPSKEQHFAIVFLLTANGEKPLYKHHFSGLQFQLYNCKPLYF